MISVKVMMKIRREPVKRVPVALWLDAATTLTPAVSTDRQGVARFDLPAGTGKVLVAGVERFHGRLEGEIPIELWSITQSESPSSGAPGEFPTGSNAYPQMQTCQLMVAGRPILTDGEGYLVDPGDWREEFARAQAEREDLVLTDEHWELLRFLRAYYAEHGVQATVREMLKHFRAHWGPERGNNRHLHQLFPRGGPQKQGNRLAGLLRTKGEH